MTQSRIDVRRLAFAAVLAAMALAVQYLESLLPPLIPGVPVKLGLANIFVLYALLIGWRTEAAAVALLRCLLLPLVTGNASGFLYTLCGGALSYIAMLALLPLYRRGKASAIGVSVAGAYCFNVGQLAVGAAVMGRAMWTYLTWMGLLSIPAGLCTGLIAARLIRLLPKRSIQA